MSLMEELAQISRNRPENLKKEKGKGTRIVGYTGRFVPEELIYASGALPYLICRGGEPEPAEATLPYMIHVINPFSRGQIGYHLLGSDPLVSIMDLIVAQCSDCHETRLADMLEYFKFPTFRLGVPPDWEKTISVEYYYRGLGRLKERLKTLTGNTVTDDRLKETTAALNEIRRLLRKINDLRKKERPPLGGHDFIRLNHYCFLCGPEVLIPKLKDLYRELEAADSPFGADAPRILLAGRVIGMGDYLVPRLIEESGGVVTAEFLDEGMWKCSPPVPVEDGMMHNLGKTYFLDRVPPSIFQPAWANRLEHLEGLIRDRRIEGVVWYQLMFDEIYDMEYPIIARAMEKMEVPLLKLDSSYEYSREAMGPLVTRVESFVQSIKHRGS